MHRANLLVMDTIFHADGNRSDWTGPCREYLAVRVDHRIEALISRTRVLKFSFFFLFKISPLKKEHGNVTAIRFEFFATLINAWSEIARGNRRAINEEKKKIGVYYQRYGVEL